jgi:anti-sigma factor RsiW
VEHIGEDDLEQYAMQTLPESACLTLEEHLLICPECRERLTAMDEYLAAMRSAAKQIKDSEIPE